MRKFPFYIVLACCLLALTSTSIFAQGNGNAFGRDDNPDRGRNPMEEMNASDIGQKHITFTKENHAAKKKDNGEPPDTNPNGPGIPGFALTTGGTTATSPITYHGGPVMGTPAIYLIFYGNWNQTSGSNTPAGRQIIIDWAQSIGGTSRYSINDSFDTSGNNVSGTATYGGVTVRTGTYKTRLRDSDILTEVDNTVRSGALGAFNPNGVYFLITSSDVTATSGFCTQYCGWHTYSARTYGRLKYSFIGNAARCLTSCAAQSISPNNNPGVDGSISILTHELEEAHTDPELNAWFDASGAENSDKCAWTFGHFQFQTANGSWANVSAGGRNFLIQRGLLHSLSGDFCMQDATHN